MNEVMTVEQIQSAVGRNALQIGTLVDSIGVINDAVKRHEAAIQKYDRKFDEIDSFIVEQREKEIIDAYEVANLSKCIKNRCVELLAECDRLDLVGKFMMKCRVDLKENTHYIGRAGIYTKKQHYQLILNYIGDWTPDGWGTHGYINHLDALERKRNES